MDSVTLAALIAQLVTAGIQAYAQLRAANPSTIPPLETILAAADADWDAIATQAKAQLAAPPAA
jgi:hypothetical protein